MDENVKQHVVPRFYLALFSTPSGEVFVRTAGLHRASLKSPTGQGYEREAFTISINGARNTVCDNGNQRIEAFCAPRIADLAVDRLPTSDQWRAIFALTANLLSRSRWTRDQYRFQLDRLKPWLPGIIEVMKECPPFPEPFGDCNLSHDGLDGIPADLQAAFDLIYPLTAARGGETIADELKTGKDCDILVAPPSNVFITSDEPTLIFASGKPVTMTLAQGFLARPSVEVFLPLKPGLACFWSPTSSRTIRPITVTEIDGYNQMIWEHRYERAFASERAVLERL